MSLTREKIWLSTALTDEDVPGALTLYFSLRRVITSHKVAVIVSQKVSKDLREVLHHVFDYVFLLEEDWNTAGLENNDFAKLFALTFKSFEKIVMLSPNMLVVKNCDELLDKCEDTLQPLAWTETGDTSLLVVRPSLPVFRGLMKGIANRNGTGVNGFLKTWIINQTPNYYFIPEKYNQRLFSQAGMLLYVLKFHCDFHVVE
ncbi:unnamed protein product [Orchesella dallaii]|uniref:Glycogenin-1 n=1 Tax=Orchesella dallaii TaxID=48710 RepID=A0ABP1Q527_9HEXA